MLQGTERVPSPVWAGGEWGHVKHLEEVGRPIIPLLTFPLGPSKAPGGRVSKRSPWFLSHGRETLLGNGNYDSDSSCEGDGRTSLRVGQSRPPHTLAVDDLILTTPWG